MERNRPEALIYDTPEERLRRHFKIAVTTFEPDFPKDKLSVPAEELFEERKRQQCILRSVKSMTDQEFVEDWMIYADISPYYAMEIGKALGEMTADAKTNPFSQIPKEHADVVGSRQFALRE